MAIITNQQPNTDLDQANLITQQIQSAWQILQRVFDNAKDFVWSDPAQAQAKFDLFGSNAGDLVLISAAYSAMVETYLGSRPTILPQGYGIQVNGDGTVTVSVPQTSSSSSGA